MSIKREYYPIADAANMIGCTEADLIHLGANWTLDIWATFDDDVRAWHQASSDDKDEPVLRQLNFGRYLLSPYDLEALEAGRKNWLCIVMSGKSSYRLIKDRSNPIPSEMFIMTSDIEQLVAEGTPSPQPIVRAFSPPNLGGPTFAKLRAALEAYPNIYAGQTPKLDDDVRPWLKSKYRCTEREAFVFGSIIAEHFGLR